MAVVDRAVEAKLREAMRGAGLTPLTTRDLLAAAGLLSPIRPTIASPLLPASPLRTASPRD
jgi:hypothetical protein